MNPEDCKHPSDEELDKLLQAARAEDPAWLESAGGFGRVEFGFETRMLGRLREQRNSSWLAWAWRFCPVAASLAIAAGVWTYVQDDSPGTESVYDAVRLAGMPVIDYYLGGDE